MQQLYKMSAGNRMLDVYICEHVYFCWTVFISISLFCVIFLWEDIVWVKRPVPDFMTMTYVVQIYNHI